MTGVIATIPRFQFSGPLGVPLIGGKLYTYQAGTTTPEPTFQDQALSIANPNPVELDATGSCTLWLDPAKRYKFLLKNALGVTQPGWPVDDISGAATAYETVDKGALAGPDGVGMVGNALDKRLLSAPSGASHIGVQAPGTGSVHRTQAAKNAEVISPADRGAVGDGLADDTAAFTALETDIRSMPIDLLGKTYLVSQQPTGNDYFNGSFKLIADGHVYRAGRNPTSANCGAEVTLKSQAADGRYTVPGGLDGAIVVLGDSISHGAFVGNSYWNGWVNILKRMLNAETGGKGYGFTPWLTLGAGSTLTQEVHDVVFTGSWVGAESTTGGADVLQGLSFTSSTAGDKILITCPTFQQWVRLWYIEKPDGGTFSYSVNGGAATNVATFASARNVAKSMLVQMVDSGPGFFQIELKVVSGSVSLCGIGYETPPNAGTGRAGNVVQNFSQSGRRLKPATEQMIDLACQGSVLVLALGYNDSGDCANDSAYNAEFQKRIDWIIKYCRKYNTTLIVSDHCWWSAPSNPARQGLKRAAVEARGIYIPLPDYLTRDQLVKTEYSDAYYMVSTLQKWSDTAHPNAAGAKWIAETVAKAMGLSCTSKDQALAFYDYPWPLQFTADSPFKNRFTTMPYLSTVHRNGNALSISLKTTTKSGSALPIGTDYPLNKSFSGADSRQVQFFNTSALDPYAPVNLNAVGSISTGIQIGLTNQIRIASYTPYVSSIDYGITLPLDVSVTKA